MSEPFTPAGVGNVDPTPGTMMTDATGEKSGVNREAPNPAEGRRALVTKLAAAVRLQKKKHEKAFKKMRADLRFVRHQRPAMPLEGEDPRARVNITQRHVANKTASLYAKNPVFTASRKKRMEYAVWDGSSSAVQALLQALDTSAQLGMPPSPLDAELMADIQKGTARKKMLDSVGRTLEIMMDWSLKEQNPPFKPRAKRLVRRAVVTGVGYLKLGYQRQLTKRPDDEAALADITDRLAQIERLQADLKDGVIEEMSAEAERLTIAKAQLDAAPQVVVREGLVLDFPQSVRIIPGPGTKELVGWVGSEWVVEEFIMSPEEVQETHGVDIKASGASYAGYKMGDYGVLKASDAADKMCCVWEMYHRKDGVLYVLVDGYPDFLAEPAPPPVYVEQFVPIYPLVFNEAENEDELMPPSDIEFIRPIQNEINRKREALRQHRIANRPFYIGQRGKLEEELIKDINSVGEHEILFTNALDATDKLENIIQPFPSKPVDPNLYETQNDLNDLQLVVGSSQSSMGKPNGSATATGDSIAETSRISTLSSNIDDLDDFLELVAKDAGCILLHELSHETVVKVVGPGAVWPELTPQDIAEEVFLDIEAGSSGRPNKDQELANIERAVPLLLQIPGVSAEWLAKLTIRTLDSRVDLEEAIASGLPSILTQNRLAQAPPTAIPGGPAAQGPAGAAGAANAEKPPGTPPGAQPAYPASAPPAAPV